MCYNTDTNKGDNNKGRSKKFKKISKKPLDKSLNLWYNNFIKDRFKSLKPKGIDTMANNTSSVRKPTKAQMFASIKAVPGLSAEQVAFIDHELELLAKKNSAEKKPTAQQTANEGVKSAIVAGMVKGQTYTITDIIKSVPGCGELTNQRVSALMAQMVKSGAVVRTEEKRKAYFALPSDEGEEV